MIKELKLKDWKSFSDATLYIDPLTIIIGSNASGKSNMLDALVFLQRVASGIGIFQAINGDVNLPSLRGGMEWVCRKPARRFTVEVLIEDDEESNLEYRYQLSVLVNGVRAEVFLEKLILLNYGPEREEPEEKTLYSTEREGADTSEIPTYFYTEEGAKESFDLDPSHVILYQIESMGFGKELKEGAKTVLSNLKKIFVFDPIPSHMRNYTPLSDRLQADGSNIAGVLAALPEARRTGVEKTLTGYLRALPEKDIERVWTEPVGKFQTDAMLYCEEGWEYAGQPQIVDARGMSDGTLRYLAIVTAMLTRDPGSLLVVEEVDNGLHPSRAHVLIEMLKKIGKDRCIDVVVTTHNPAVLDAAGVRMVPFITVAHRDVKTGASKLTQLEDLRQLPKLMAAGSLGHLTTEGLIEAALKQEGKK